MKKKLKILTGKILEIKIRLAALTDTDRIAKSAYTRFLHHYEQERAELLSKLGRK